MKFTWKEDDGTEWTLTIAGWLFLILTIVSTVTLIGSVIYIGSYCEPSSKEASNASLLGFLSVAGILVGVISTPFCTKCVKCDKSISQVIHELIEVMKRF